MANRPANAGSGGVGPGRVGSGRGLASMGEVAPPLDAVAPPPPVHHDFPRSVLPRTASGPRAGPARAHPSQPAVGHRTARRLQARAREDAGAGPLAWIPYLLVLAGAALGMFLAWQGSKYAGRGTGVLGCSLIVAALARLILPTRYAGLLASRRRTSDVLAFAVFGIAVLAVALTLP